MQIKSDSPLLGLKSLLFQKLDSTVHHTVWHKSPFGASKHREKLQIENCEVRIIDHWSQLFP